MLNFLVTFLILSFMILGSWCFHLVHISSHHVELNFLGNYSRLQGTEVGEEMGPLNFCKLPFLMFGGSMMMYLFCFFCSSEHCIFIAAILRKCSLAWNPWQATKRSAVVSHSIWKQSAAPSLFTFKFPFCLSHSNESPIFQIGSIILQQNFLAYISGYIHFPNFLLGSKAFLPSLF